MVGVWEVASRIVRIHIFPPLLGVPEVTPIIDTISADDEVGALRVTLYVIVGAASLLDNTAIPITPPKEQTCEPSRARVWPDILWKVFV